jgi:hypothetical protein
MGRTDERPFKVETANGGVFREIGDGGKDVLGLGRDRGWKPRLVAEGRETPPESHEFIGARGHEVGAKRPVDVAVD